jgi:microcystin-dependent protein
MSEPYIGQIETFAFGFAPKNWALCGGQLMPIAQNQALFSLLGTTYGGDGIRTFALPNLQSRVAVGQGGSYGLGQVGGEENHTLTVAETAGHTHSLGAAANVELTKNVDTPSNAVALATTSGKDAGGNPLVVDIYVTDAGPNQPLAPTAVANTGGHPHTNLMPYTTLNFCIALSGIFPSRN